MYVCIYVEREIHNIDRLHRLVRLFIDLLTDVYL